MAPVSIERDGATAIVVDNPPVNAISAPVRHVSFGVRNSAETSRL